MPKSTTTDKAPEQAAEAEVQESAPKECGFSCYIGPTLLGVIQHNTLYPCPASEAVKRPEVVEAIKKHPVLAKLIIPGDELAAAGQQINVKGAPLYRAYRDALIL